MENITVKEICPTTTQSWVKQGALLVDVRETDEVNTLSYDVKNIIHIPLTEFEERFQEVPKDRNVVVVCRSGGRSLRAAGYLIHHGYDPEKVVNMQHGIIRWVQKGFPVKGDVTSVAPVVSKDRCCGGSDEVSESGRCNNGTVSSENNCC